MYGSRSQTRRVEGAVTTAIARVRAEGGEASEDAILVGDAAGIVEWANASWTRMTGSTRDETVHKPISHFLDSAGIELELVDFVGRTFLEGRPCVIEFPFEMPEGREIRIRLEVESLRGGSGEPAAFVATAHAEDHREVHDPSSDPIGADGIRGRSMEMPKPLLSPPSRGPRTPSIARSGKSPIRLSEFVRRACESRFEDAQPRTQFDLALASDLPGLEIAEPLFRDLVNAMLDAAMLAISSDWGVMTVSTGRVQSARSFASEVHPVVVSSEELAKGPHLFLEVHDTGSPFDPEAADRIEGRSSSSTTSTASSAREGALSRARKLCDALGVALHIDSTPGCGNQALLLLPIGQRRPVPPRPQ